MSIAEKILNIAAEVRKNGFNPDLLFINTRDFRRLCGDSQKMYSTEPKEVGKEVGLDFCGMKVIHVRGFPKGRVVAMDSAYVLEASVVSLYNEAIAGN